MFSKNYFFPYFSYRYFQIFPWQNTTVSVSKLSVLIRPLPVSVSISALYRPNLLPIIINPKPISVCVSTLYIPDLLKININLKPITINNVVHVINIVSLVKIRIIPNFVSVKVRTYPSHVYYTYIVFTKYIKNNICHIYPIDNNVVTQANVDGDIYKQFNMDYKINNISNLNNKISNVINLKSEISEKIII